MNERAPADGSDADHARTSRRGVLGGIGALAGFSALGGVASAGGDDSEGDSGGERPKYTLSQGDACIPLAPLSGDKPVEELYDYRVPEQHASDTNGGSDPGEGPYYSSAGTRDLQEHNTSLLFLYDGPEGLSLVVVHGAVGGPEGEGGSATFDVVGVPDGADWVVKDDLYRDPETGDIADTNYDRWETDGTRHRIDWTWAGRGTDGGALRGLGDQFEIGIDPAFNEAASLWNEHYEGTVDDWVALTAGPDGIRRVALSLDNPVTVRSGACADPLFDVEAGDVSVVVRRNRIFVRVHGSTVSVSQTGVDVDVDAASDVDVDESGGVDVEVDSSSDGQSSQVSVQQSSQSQHGSDGSSSDHGVDVDTGDDDQVDVDVSDVFGDDDEDS